MLIENNFVFSEPLFISTFAMEASSLMMLFPVFNSWMRTRGLLVPLNVLSTCKTPFGFPLFSSIFLGKKLLFFLIEIPFKFSFKNVNRIFNFD